MKKFAAIGLCIISTSLWSGAASAMTLQDALQLAYQQNHDLQLARSAVKQADEQLPQAKAFMRPTATAETTAGLTNRDAKSPSSSTDNTLFNRGVNLSVEQPLYRGGRTDAAIKQAEADIRTQRALLIDMEQAVMGRVVNAYVEVYRTQKVVAARENNKRVLTERLRKTEARFRAGAVTRTDVTQTKARLAGAVADLALAVRDSEAAVANFVDVVGSAPGQVAIPRWSLNAPADLPSALDLARQEHPSILAMRFSEESARQGVRSVRGERLPTLSLEGSAGKEWEAATDNDRVQETALLARLSIPLYTGGAVVSRQRQAQEAYNAQSIRLRQKQSEIDAFVTEAWYNLQSQSSRREAAVAGVAAAEQALQGVLREQEQGQRTVLDALDAEQELLSAKVDLATAEAEAVSAMFRLLEACGDLTARKLGLDVDHYEVNTHYDKVKSAW